MGKKIDHTNKKYGRLTVLEEAEPYIRSNGGKIRRVKCLCECSNIVIVRARNLTKKHTQSCGCLNLDQLRARKKHGHTIGKYSKEYVAWLAMKQRCYYKEGSHYHNYGERGITVCDEWLESFEAFYNHIGPCPDPSYTLDRIDSNGDYKPGNVRWASRTAQMLNQNIRCSNTSGYKGVRLIKGKQKDKWGASIGVNYKQIYLGTFDTFEEAVQARKAAEELYHKPLL